ncbi:MAG: hypothetical protein AB1568_03130 [Thermodesulfobacteriota bacterium]
MEVEEGGVHPCVPIGRGLFLVADDEAGFLPELLDRRVEEKVGLRDRFVKPAPWNG